MVTSSEEAVIQASFKRALFTLRPLKFRMLIQLVFFSGIALISCKEIGTKPARDNRPESAKQITILYTSDEHGWMEATDQSGGAAGMMGLWRDTEGFSEDSTFLVLSAGDNWTGPAISTWFRGESMTEVMNAMDYDAVAIGNHEFDFKVEGLGERISQAQFTFLAANIREKGSGNVPEFATPYLIKDINTVRVGIIGLAYISTPMTTYPTHVANYEFVPYEEALNHVIPEVRTRGAELLMVLGHITAKEMRSLAPTAHQLGISLIFGGHSHDVVNETVNDVALLQAGAYMEYYGKVSILFDTEADTIVSLTTAVVKNQGGTPDETVAGTVAKWRTRMDTELAETIGYASVTIDRYSSALANMITDSWLEAISSADVSLTNQSGIRQSIPAGEITLATIVGVLPFENFILQLDLTGDQLIECARGLVMGGMTTVDGYRLMDGTPIHPDSAYEVVTTDYLYSRDDFQFRQYDPEPFETGIHFRQPVIDWIRSLNTSSSNPLDRYLDVKNRR